jgi:hypothetical protein
VSTRLSAASLICLWAIAAAAQAEEQILVQGEVPLDILGTESAEAFASRLRNAVAQLDYAIIPACADQRVFKLRAAGSFAPNDQTSNKLAEEGKPVWLVEVTATGCTADRLHNVYAFPRKAEPAFLVAGFPGQTQASLDLQGDAHAALTQIAPELVDSCDKAPLVINTRVVEDTAEGKPWTEEWSLRVCNAPTRVKAIFTPGPNGVSLNIETTF